MKIRDLQRGWNEAYYFNIIGIQEEKYVPRVGKVFNT